MDKDLWAHNVTRDIVFSFAGAVWYFIRYAPDRIRVPFGALSLMWFVSFLADRLV